MKTLVKMMRQRRFLPLGMMLSVFWVMTGSFQLAAQEGDAAPEAAVAAVIAVDQSSNLFGKVELTQPGLDLNPPFLNGGGERAVEVGLYSMQWLMSFQAQQRSVGRSPDVYTSLGFFSSSFNDVVGWQKHETDNLAEAQAAFLDVEERVRSESRSMESKTSQTTNYVNALDGALRQFDALANAHPQMPADTRKIIFLITDGIPCVSGWGTACNNINAVEARAQHFDQLQALLQSKARGIEIRLIPLSSAYRSTDIRGLGQEWASLQQGRYISQIAEVIGDAGSVSRVMNAQLMELLPESYQIGQQLTSAVFPANPYLQELYVVMYKTNAAQRLQLIEAGGTAPLEATTRGRVTVQGDAMLVEMWTIRNPMPGDWRIGSLPDGVQVYVLDKPLNVSLESEAGVQYLPVVFRLRLGEDGLLPQYPPAYRLTGSVVIQPPDGANPVSVPLEAKGAGVFEARYTPSFSGNHRAGLNVRVDAGALPAGVTSAATSFTVAPVAVRIEGLDDDRAPLRGEPRQFRLGFIDRSGAIVDGIQVANFSLIIPPVGAACPTGTALAAPQEGTVYLTDPVNPSEPDAWFKQYTFATEGAQNICVLVQIVDTANANQPLTVRSETVPVTVIKETRVALVLNLDGQEASLAGRPQTYQYDAPIFPLLNLFQQPRPVVLVRAYEMADETLTDIRVAVGNELPADVAQDMMCLVIERLGGGGDLLTQQGIKLIPTGANGEWRVQLEALAPGDYDITLTAYRDPMPTVEGDDSIVPRCDQVQGRRVNTGRIGSSVLRFHPEAVVRAKLIVGTNYMPLVLVLAGALVVVGSGWTIGRWVKRRLNAIHGELVITRITKGQETELFTIPLAAYKTDDITVSLKDLPIVEPPIVNLRVTKKSTANTTEIVLKYGLYNPSGGIGESILEHRELTMAVGERCDIPYNGWRKQTTYHIRWQV
jgi:hypothetical protein